MEKPKNYKKICNIMSEHMHTQTKYYNAYVLMEDIKNEFKKEGLKPSDLLKWIDFKNKSFKHVDLMTPTGDDKPIKVFGQYYGSVQYFNKE